MNDSTTNKKPDSETRRHVRGSSLMLAGRMISIGINFVVQVLIVRYLSKEGYGAFAYGYSIAILASRMTGLGTDKAANRFIPIYHEETKLSRIKGSLFIAFGTIAVMGVLLVGLVASLRNILAETMVRDPLSLSVLVMIISLAPLLALENLLEKLLAIFGRVKSLFFRRFLLTPLLRLAAVCCLMASGGDAYFLAGAYVLSTFVGVCISAQILWRVFRDDKILSQLSDVKSELPAKRLFRFGVPLLSSDVVFGLRTSLVVVLLESFHGATSVASFRAILPVARLNQVVSDSFRMLYVPTASRMFARGETQEISQLYWRSSAWIAVLTLPVLLISFSLATPTAVLLFSDDYTSSGPILSVIALGLYLNAAFGFNTLTLRVYDRVSTIMKIDLSAGTIAVVLNVALVPRYGPLGGAAASCVVLIGQNIAYQLALFRAGQLQRIPGAVARIHISVITIAAALLLFQMLTDPHIVVSFSLAAIATAIVWLTCFRTLQIRESFPELDRFLPRHRGSADRPPRNKIVSEQLP